MDYKMMRHINDIQIQKEVDARIARDAIRQKKLQDSKDKHDAVIMIIATIIGMLAVGFLGG